MIIIAAGAGLPEPQGDHRGFSPTISFHAAAFGEITIDARLIAPHLGLTPEEMMAELRCGLVYRVAEKGTAADDGSIRLTFRYRARECRIVSSSMPVARS
jgi:hypothetical protein